jgi:hypothetical protein
LLKKADPSLVCFFFKGSIKKIQIRKLDLNKVTHL